MTGPAVRPAHTADLPRVVELLAAQRLPTDGVEEHFGDFVVAEHDGALAGVAGVECYQGHALLRSVAVDPALRGHGLGRRLVEAAIARAQAKACGTQWLLTTTAGDYFPRFGFVPASREAMPTEMHASRELTGACPASPVVMMRQGSPA